MATAARKTSAPSADPWTEWPAICIPAAAARSLDGFRDWVHSDDFPQRGRVSFINGEILIDMSPDELETHNKVKTEITSVLHRLSRELNLGTFYSDRTLLTNDDADLSTEPDGLFASWDAFRSGRLKRAPRKDHPDQYIELRGSPDCVIEIISRSSVAKDAKRLRDSYHQAGVAEYWLINALEKQIDFQVLTYRASGYAAAKSRQGWRRSQVFRHDFRLRRQRDELGDWQYLLDFKPV
ncbi:MAG TPA: Uma2 family endonuclease [Pirellulales bacterium]|nr:Uma2 family endonuclease [Pirellulales bacterium]